MSTIPFPEVIDSTMLSAFRSCPTKFFREYMLHYKPMLPSIHLHAGAAFARGLEVARRAFYEEGAGEEDAVARGLTALIKAYGDFNSGDSPKSLERMAGALEYYFNEFPMSSDHATPKKLADGKRAIEFSFAEPLPINHPVTGDPIIFCGRSDMVADFAEGCYIFDDKTTSSLGATWAKQWEMRAQFTGYSWAARKAGIPVSGVLVRGISILKTKYDKAQAITSRSEMEMERWLKQTVWDIQRMIEMWRNDDWAYSLDEACNSYGGCMFMQACKSPDPQPWLNLYFEKRVWDPLAREEKVYVE